ncbi:unnamed protein product [Protopolystoma xenopodis]|uniref:Uncharacterized protein n=1 Tax=Protopolystoma xenopodis TaxID=117903 RepID=A0A3S5BA76_9PLAT|nr:unnamed protein product [Protopolystoma xenopodis]
MRLCLGREESGADTIAVACGRGNCPRGGQRGQLRPAEIAQSRFLLTQASISTSSTNCPCRQTQFPTELSTELPTELPTKVPTEVPTELPTA